MLWSLRFHSRSRSNSGLIHLLATFGEERTQQFAGTPTIREIGLPIVITSPLGIMGPAGLPPAVSNRLQDAFRKWTATDDYKSTLDQFVLSPWFKTGAQVDAWMEQQFAQDKAFAARAGVAVKR